MTHSPLVDRFHFMAAPNASAKTPVRADVPANTGSDQVAVLRIYDPIDSWGGPWGLSAKEFVEALDGIPEDTAEIHLHINSPGGMVWEGLAILNAIRQHPARVTTVVDGLAASAASFIAMGADEVVMAPNSELMIHNPYGLAIGDHLVMAKMSDDLVHETKNLADIYRRKAGGDLEAWLAAMADESWYSAEEAVEAGLADRLLDDAPSDQSNLKARFNLSTFAHAGRDHAPAPRVRTRTAAAMAAPRPPAEPEEHNPIHPTKEEPMATLAEGIRQRLGITDESTNDEALLAALDETLTEQASNDTEVPAVPAGTVAVDEATLAQLRADAAAGREARDQQVRTDREAAVNAAVTDGRIPPARAAHWINQLEADPGASEVLAGLPKGLVNLAPAGFSGGVDESTDDNVLYTKAWGTEEKKGA
ncbi:head maturation protease, ClpP-related [Propionibacteriaceae bacterium Y2011]